MSFELKFEALEQFCQQFLGHHQSVALTTHDGMAIQIRYSNLPELGTLPVAAQTTHQYLKLKNGDIALTNDPYSGGTLLSTMNLVMGIAADPNKKDVNLLLVKKVPLKPKVYLGKNIEEEGVRIPPTPILLDGRLNTAILDAISAHPLVPPNFMNSMVNSMEEMKGLHRKFFSLDEVYKLDWSRTHIRNLFKTTLAQTQNLLGEIRSGEQIEELELNDGSRLKLKVDVSDDKVTFDFSGSEMSESIHLTHSAALGACTGALVSLFGSKVIVNNGLFQCIDVVAPEGTMVHAKYPAPVYFGMTDGAAVVANLALKAFGSIDDSKRFALGGSSCCSFDIEFDEGHFFETLAAGSGASSRGIGVDAINIWRRTHLQPSVEAIESRFPLKVENFGVRANSGGDGKYSGGRGQVKIFELQDKGVLKWAIMEPSEKPLGTLGGKDAQTAEVFLQKKGGKKELLPQKGRLNLEAGDRLIFHSSGGGGYGESLGTRS